MTPEARVIAASDHLAALIEAAARGLKHRRHAKHLAPARARIAAVMRSYFGRQKTAMLGALKPLIDRELSLHPREALREAEAWEDEARVPGGEPGAGEWTSGGAGAAETAPVEHEKTKAEIARESKVRTGKLEQAIADRSERVLSDAVGIARTPDNSAFDLENEHMGVEIKTLIHGKNEKITMSKKALARKADRIQETGVAGHTVVVDRRAAGMEGPAHYYHREGFGSFRLKSMTRVTLDDLRSILRPK